MDSIENDLINSIEEAGFNVSNEVPAELQEEQQAPAGIPEGVEADFDFSGTQQTEEPATEPQATEQVSETTQVEVEENTQPQAEESSLNTETNVEQQEDVDVDGLVLGYLSETLGMDLNSIDDLKSSIAPQQAEIDERVKVIADFVEKTGRSPEEWFQYQAINPSEMDDLTAIKMSMTSEYPDLNSEEIDMLVGSKYKLDEDLYTEDEIKLSKLQLKIDANKSRTAIEDLRTSYTMPIAKETEAVQSPIDEQWIEAMTNETNALEALSFDLPSGEFNFGITDDYRSQLIDKNSNLETFFDQYVDQNGQWDYDTFNSHRALVDNIDAIAKSIYQQGLSDGQRKIVDQAANVSSQSPNVATGNNSGNNLEQQILDALNVDKTLRFL
jgi:hypothetical protein